MAHSIIPQEIAQSTGKAWYNNIPLEEHQEAQKIIEKIPEIISKAKAQGQDWAWANGREEYLLFNELSFLEIFLQEIRFKKKTSADLHGRSWIMFEWCRQNNLRPELEVFEWECVTPGRIGLTTPFYRIRIRPQP